MALGRNMVTLWKPLRAQQGNCGARRKSGSLAKEAPATPAKRQWPHSTPPRLTLAELYVKHVRDGPAKTAEQER